MAGVVLVQASGGLSLVGNAITGVDNSIKAVIDIKKMFAPVVVPPIHPVVVPPVRKKVVQR